ncbi:hypothetical protein COC42_07445 [Sphingomonas spermidinifaciens]|uniref:DUF4440 domain-containing protein n=1 Tax=Sphingomonas spermidinifaciens TaxID=1141889 RepID=A0A2A4B7R8_9SPHN|nr:DUF4440 domain-containing protein [Sphingomonas spermidinifaciens]PCD04127.1 hypothetical protein COC42_07445 [Sphingomonas spermidinifaciens]
MSLWLAALALQAGSVVDAERAFAAAAQREGQWTAFRRYAAPDAILFAPGPVNAQALLKSLSDPPAAVRWQPTESHVSCDGRFAVNTGVTQWPDGRVGYFTTVWRREGDGTWRWIVDHGDFLPSPRPGDRLITFKASCDGKPAPLPGAANAVGADDGGASTDGTIAWRWSVRADGGRTLSVSAWDGRTMRPVIEDRVEAPAR